LKKYDLQESYNNFKIKFIVSFCESGPRLLVQMQLSRELNEHAPTARQRPQGSHVYSVPNVPNKHYTFSKSKLNKNIQTRLVFYLNIRKLLATVDVISGDGRLICVSNLRLLQPSLQILHAQLVHFQSRHVFLQAICHILLENQ